MNKTVGLIMLAIFFIIQVIAAYWIHKTYRSFSSGSNNSGLQKAKHYLYWAAFTSKIVTVVFIISVVLYIIFGLETAAATGGKFITFLLFILVVGLAAEGVLDILGTEYYREGGSGNEKTVTYKDGIISGALTGGTILGVIIAMFLHSYEKKQEEIAKAEENDYELIAEKLLL